MKTPMTTHFQDSEEVSGSLQHFFSEQREERKVQNLSSEKARPNRTMVMNFPENFESEGMARELQANLSAEPDQIPITRERAMSGNVGSKFVDDRFLVDKIQSTLFEYNHLLTSQLDEQR
mmetsp:Transcript_39083/g.59576  ORF Transcript_39083/g.59576 Transcript_39083/m.59576 type:complete len:120 (+) Transcript_39083:926-1285(+)